MVDFRLIFAAIVAFIALGVMMAALILFTRAKLVKTDECEILINDDEDLTINSPGGGTLLSVLTSNGIPIPSPCGGKATCKQCKVQVIEGVDPPLQTDIDTFTKKQLNEGWRLSCQSKLKHDIHVHVDEHALGVKQWKAKVIKNENVATFIKELIVELPQGEVIDTFSQSVVSSKRPIKPTLPLVH